MHYYEEHPFTEMQAINASESVLLLMRQKRFFLYQHDKQRGSSEDPDYTLNPGVFKEALKLDEDLRSSYQDVKQTAWSSVLEAEADLGIRQPDLGDNKQLVACNRYTGGFDICRVYPVTAFTKFAPESEEVLVKQRLHQLMDGETEDDLAPKTIRGYREEAEESGSLIWQQLEAIEAQDPENRRCLVLLQSRINMGSFDSDGDFAEGRLWDMQDFPHAVGFLFHEYSMRKRIVRHSHIVTSTSRTSHVNIQHWSDSSEAGGSPRIYYHKKSGYTGSVMFATVL